MKTYKFFLLFAWLLLSFLAYRLINNVSLSLFLSFLVVLAIFSFSRTQNHKGKVNSQLPPLTKEKEQVYKNNGMTNKEILFFRDTMNNAKTQIIQLQENIALSSKLKAIDLRNDTTKIAKSLFKALAQEPKKLHLANHFLYTHLPNIVDLTSKYIEITNHELKNKDTYEKLEETAQIVDQLSKLIQHDYEQFIADDLEELDLEISIAKNSLNRDTKA